MIDNTNDTLLETFFFDTHSLLEQLDELLVNAENAGSFTADEVNQIFRSMHTIKGSSAMLELRPLTEVAHHMEDLFFFIREHGMGMLDDKQKSQLFNLLFQSTDHLRLNLEKSEQGEPLEENIDKFTAEINQFLCKLNSSDELSSFKSSADSASVVSSAKEPLTDAPYTVHVLFEEDCGMENLRSFMLVNFLKDTGTDYTFYPPDVETNPDTCALVKDQGFYLYTQTEKDANTVIAVIKSSSSIRSYELIKRTAPAAGGHSRQQMISVNVSKLDQLQAIASEIAAAESRSRIQELTTQLQELVLSLRMVPVSGVFQKMNRIVRDMTKALHKDVHLRILGEDTVMDKSIIDNIAAPIMHLVRNAMDHGIESNVQDRLDAGKPAQGEITLSASHTKDEVIISVSDDGQGMNPDVILAKAAQKGILTKPESQYSKEEILSLLMTPGFSTSQTVTEFSGRGVGLDVVKDNVESMGGTVTITSELGQGSCTTLRIHTQVNP